MRSTLSSVFAVLSLALALLAGPATARESGDPADNLLYDVRRIAHARDPSGWGIDRYEIDERMPDTLQSVCRATEPTRNAALAEAELQVSRLGGPLERAVDANGGDLRGLDALVSATHVAKLLGEAVARAPSECPPWLVPEPGFEPLQGSSGRFDLSVEAGSAGMLQYAEQHPDGTAGLRWANGGGARLLLGRGFDNHVSVRSGLDAQLTMLSRHEDSAADVPLQAHGALPVVVRYSDLSSHLDLEVAPVLMITQGDPRWRFGGRLGVAVGLSRLRKGNVIPWLGAGATVDLLPPSEAWGPQLNVRGGLRGGVDWGPH